MTHQNDETSEFERCYNEVSKTKHGPKTFWNLQQLLHSHHGEINFVFTNRFFARLAHWRFPANWEHSVACEIVDNTTRRPKPKWAFPWLDVLDTLRL